MNLSSSKAGRHMIDILFTLALFCVFAAASLTVVLIGANVYKNTVHKMDLNFETNTSLTYVTTKIRQFDSAGSIYLAAIQGENALVLEEPMGDQVYQTWIYHYDGALRELFINRNNTESLQLALGQELMKVNDFAVEAVNGDLLILRASNADGSSASQLVGVRSDEKGWK